MLHMGTPRWGGLAPHMPDAHSNIRCFLPQDPPPMRNTRGYGSDTRLDDKEPTSKGRAPCTNV